MNFSPATRTQVVETPPPVSSSGSASSAQHPLSPRRVSCVQHAAVHFLNQHWLGRGISLSSTLVCQTSRSLA
ncbi:hypothetical protein F441_04037 [Phytophthora nicotianae CJ01A1]|uniref:Uncharacterized protein n=5 Tax=Phytophthora nicotianae TaxID=4792 RepID=V9FN74_PHYNI|nr:hypothetical protein F443_04058 [Phytophthora nicotianae P1569]ETK92759.1 hypothetical protein L915_03940 [Phytophthora nicotianae]ETO81602.1 hypothetical protein F444_04113 [Phytophthora nicotianae P1976]ETP22708.1 hypothetical protein F441_04037 [Phytophthora nicotianae CJ01A1]ETP50685.1 hypothetical protein F442_04042 [Phytophthora nicotianae P10297]